MCNIKKNDQVRLRNENAEIETEIDELKRKIAKYTTMWNSLPKKPKLQVTTILNFSRGSMERSILVVRSRKISDPISKLDSSQALP